MDLIKKYNQAIRDHNRQVTDGVIADDKRCVTTNDEYDKMFNECLQACYVLLNRVTKEGNCTRFVFPVSNWYDDESTRERFQQAFTHTLQQFGISVCNFGINQDGDVYSDLEWVPYITKK